MSVKSVNACNSYSRFSEVTQKHKCPLWKTRQTCDCQNEGPTFVQISNILKVCVQNVLHVLECKLEDVDATA